MPVRVAEVAADGSAVINVVGVPGTVLEGWKEKSPGRDHGLAAQDYITCAAVSRNAMQGTGGVKIRQNMRNVCERLTIDGKQDTVRVTSRITVVFVFRENLDASPAMDPGLQAGAGGIGG